VVGVDSCRISAGGQLSIVLVFFVAGINSLASGFAGLPFMNIVAKTIPADRPVRILAAGCFRRRAGPHRGVIVGVVLSAQNPQPFPYNVGTLFVLSWFAAAGGLTAFALIKEPPGDVREDGYTFTAHLQRAARLPRRNQNLRYLLIARVVILLSYVAAPFYSIYSINALGAPVSIIGVYMGAHHRGAVIRCVRWRWRGNKIVMQQSPSASS
jgi:hypothetical protein